MANVIDSLKRLERIGSEGSETVRKILEAADQVGKKIVKNAHPSLYGLCFTGLMSPNGIAEFCRVPSGEPVGALHGTTVDGYLFCRYIITEVALLVDGFDGRFREVSSDRESALRLSRDIANGLLDLFSAIQQQYSSINGRATRGEDCPNSVELEEGFETLQNVLSKSTSIERATPVVPPSPALEVKSTAASVAAVADADRISKLATLISERSAARGGKWIYSICFLASAPIREKEGRVDPSRVQVVGSLPMWFRNERGVRETVQLLRGAGLHAVAWCRNLAPGGGRFPMWQEGAASLLDPEQKAVVLAWVESVKVPVIPEPLPHPDEGVKTYTF